jgi:hypothetical protein
VQIGDVRDALMDYKLFHIVREHIEALHLGRRQLLAQTLSEDKTNNLRRDCVARLVSGNIVQGLDIIVIQPGEASLLSISKARSTREVVLVWSADIRWTNGHRRNR